MDNTDNFPFVSTMYWYNKSIPAVLNLFNLCISTYYLNILKFTHITWFNLFFFIYEQIKCIRYIYNYKPYVVNIYKYYYLILIITI